MEPCVSCRFINGQECRRHSPVDSKYGVPVYPRILDTSHNWCGDHEPPPDTIDKQLEELAYGSECTIWSVRLIYRKVGTIEKTKKVLDYVAQFNVSTDKAIDWVLSGFATGGILKEEALNKCNSTKDAIRKSIGHWVENLKAAEEGRYADIQLGSSVCPLCVLNKLNCKTCPIGQKTQSIENGCAGTPYQKILGRFYFCKHTTKGADKELIGYIWEEIHFLESLLD